MNHNPAGVITVILALIGFVTQVHAQTLHYQREIGAVDSRGEIGGNTQSNLGHVDVEKLIDELQNIESYSLGIDPFADFGNQFLLSRSSPDISVGVKARTVETNPSMEKLLAMGVDAIPVLLKHLSDKRTTKLIAVSYTHLTLPTKRIV